jgi:hypothetical protein
MRYGTNLLHCKGHDAPPIVVFFHSIIASISLLKTLVEVFDGGATELYPDAHGGILLLSHSIIVL